MQTPTSLNIITNLSLLKLNTMQLETPGLYCTNASGSSNLLLNFIFEHVSMVSESQNNKTDTGVKVSF